MYPLQNDFFLVWIFRLCAGIAGALVFLIAIFVAREALQAFSVIGFSDFFTDVSWNPSESSYNLTPMLAGSLLTAAGAVLLAAPLAILSAVFCRFYAAPLPASVYRRVVELLAGIPSVVYGFWGLTVLIPLINDFRPPGASLMAGILILSIMILPTIAVAADAGFASVPRQYLYGAAALGLSRWTTVWKLVVPASRGALMTGIILGVGRAIGETMAVLMVCGNVVQIPDSLFDPVRTLTANIALEMAYALDEHRSALFVTGLLLLLLVVVFMMAANWISREGAYD